MPVSVVIGGQYGSEGKGKVSAFIAKEMNASAVIRCGGTNSGHTVYNDEGEKYIFRQLPTASIQPSVISILSVGSYIDVDLLLKEIEVSGINENCLCIDPFAVIIKESHKLEESTSGLTGVIGSTGSGTGAAVKQRLLRKESTIFAKDIPTLSKYINSSVDLIHELLIKNKRIILEGTQGFGLSLLHSNLYPYVTSRDTTASGFLSECGISPFDVDDIVLVIRTFPIRVSGNSGPLKNEISWEDISNEAEISEFKEFTSVTKSVRRVGRFDKDVVIQAIKVNRPTRIMLNHLDYIKKEHQTKFIQEIESLINFKIDKVGLNPTGLESRSELEQALALS